MYAMPAAGWKSQRGHSVSRTQRLFFSFPFIDSASVRRHVSRQRSDRPQKRINRFSVAHAG